MSNPKNSENEGLPARWRRREDGYYYQVLPGTEHQWEGRREFFLGRSLPEAYRNWTKCGNSDVVIQTIGDLLDRYGLEVISNKALATQDSNAFATVQLKKALGELLISQLTPQLVSEYFDRRRFKVAARREIEVLSHAYTKAVEWGCIDCHPFGGMLRLPKEEAKVRHIEDWEVLEMMSIQPRHKAGSVRAIQAFIRLMLLTGLRRVELLRVKLESIQEHAFSVDVRRTGKQVTFPWTEELRTAVMLAKNSRPAEISVWLFCKADGTGYFNEENGRADGWDSMWGRFVDRVLLETKIEKRFTEHDLRARAVYSLPCRQHPANVSTLALARAVTTVDRGAAERLDTVCVWKDGLQFVPISPKYVAAVPVAVFKSATNGVPVHQKKRKVQISLATPAWADREQIQALYELARKITRESGSRQVVDHIVPLHHPLVCGLHVPANLRVIPERINAAKHNRFEIAGEELIRLQPAGTFAGSIARWFALLTARKMRQLRISRLMPKSLMA